MYNNSSFLGGTKDELVMKPLKDYYESLLVIKVKTSFHAVMNFLVFGHNYLFFLLIYCLGTPYMHQHQAITDLTCTVTYYTGMMDYCTVKCLPGTSRKYLLNE